MHKHIRQSADHLLSSHVSRADVTDSEGGEGTHWGGALEGGVWLIRLQVLYNTIM